MENTLFDDLVQSLKEAKEIRQGDAKASRRFTVTMLDLKSARTNRGETL